MTNRIYFNVDMLDDALLKRYVTPEIVKETSDYVETVALSFGVPANKIAVPTTYAVTRLATLFAYMTTAQRKAMFSAGGDGTKIESDSFALKFKLYKELLNDWLKQLTSKSFTGNDITKKRTFPSTMPMWRN